LESAVEAFGAGGRYFPSRKAAVEFLPGAFTQCDTVLVKGSRSTGMEVVLRAFQGDEHGGEG
jgi:UDP-N-acetylmuramoyl-tripeptide--D-alanyl-D-alanine ligase